MTQTDMVLEMLKDWPITSLDAIRELGCTRLAAHIGFLKERGFLIHSERVKSINRFGKSVAHARYSLMKASHA
jgi:hypothetical protein